MITTRQISASLFSTTGFDFTKRAQAEADDILREHPSCALRVRTGDFYTSLTMATDSEMLRVGNLIYQGVDAVEVFRYPPTDNDLCQTESETFLDVPFVDFRIV